MDLVFDDVTLHTKVSGPEIGPTLVLTHSLGTDMRIWDGILELLPHALRVIRWDLRGHGQSQVTPPPYAMGTLVRDAERVCDAHDVRECIFVGISIGGLIAQALAVKRPDITRGLVLANTAVKIGTSQIWHDRVALVEQGGMAAIADATLERWFAPGFDDYDLWKDRLLAAPAAGYIGASHAIAGTDLLTPTSGLRLPTLAVAGARDGATPPDLVRELADLIPGAQFALIQGAGHLPCIDKPKAFCDHVNAFLAAQAHV